MVTYNDQKDENKIFSSIPKITNQNKATDDTIPWIASSVGVISSLLARKSLVASVSTDNQINTNEEPSPLITLILSSAVGVSIYGTIKLFKQFQNLQ